MEPDIRNNIGMDPAMHCLSRKRLSDADLMHVLESNLKIRSRSKLASISSLANLLTQHNTLLC